MATQGNDGRKEGEVAARGGGGGGHGVVDVGDHFAAVAGGGDRHRCAHCDTVVSAKQTRKAHMGACKSLPQDVREVLDHAAV